MVQESKEREQTKNCSVPSFSAENCTSSCLNKNCLRFDVCTFYKQSQQPYAQTFAPSSIHPTVSLNSHAHAYAFYAIISCFLK